jgi:hypothetical protein
MEVTPYPTLLGLDWEFDNQMIIYLKKRNMVLKVEYLKVIAPLDPTGGKRYVEPTKRKWIDNLYNMTAQMDDYVNPIDEGILSLRSIISCTLDSKDALENWKQRMHEVLTRKCARITRALRWIGTKIVQHSNIYLDWTPIEYFIKEFEMKIVD